MSKKNFSGKYYKFVLNDGFTFAIIKYKAFGECGLQLITQDASYQIKRPESFKMFYDYIEFNIKEDAITLKGYIKIDNMHPLKHSAMGPYILFSMECSHEIYSMYHDLAGYIIVNGVKHSCDGGFGYIEGDKGKNFPNKYTWYNSIGDDYGVTVAIATIPFGIFKFVGFLGFVSYQDKEYRLCSYNCAKIKIHSKNKIVLKKGKYFLEIDLSEVHGKSLKAPQNGTMNRIIKENVSVKTSFRFMHKDKIILERTDEHSSVEQMFEEE